LTHFPIIIENQNLLLIPEKAIFWIEKKILLIADLHLGKVGHFRKSGIPIPRELEQEDLAVLSDLILAYQPEELLILGDFFHSHMNSDWNWIALWRQQFPHLRIHLVKGNHDLLKEEDWRSMEIEMHENILEIPPFSFCHHPPVISDHTIPKTYYFCGHIHPAYILKGMAGQSKRLPCFYVEPGLAILPSFGRFTGGHALKRKVNSQIYLISGQDIIKLPSKKPSQFRMGLNKE